MDTRSTNRNIRLSHSDGSSVVDRIHSFGLVSQHTVSKHKSVGEKKSKNIEEPRAVRSLFGVVTTLMARSLEPVSGRTPFSIGLSLKYLCKAKHL